MKIYFISKTTKEIVCLYLDTSVGKVDPVASPGVVSVASLRGLEVGVGEAILNGVTVLVVGGNLKHFDINQIVVIVGVIILKSKNNYISPINIKYTFNIIFNLLIRASKLLNFAKQ